MAKRLLLVHRYFWPDVAPYAHILRFIGGHLVEQGYEVSVFCGPVTYNGVYDGPPRHRSEVLDGARIHRVGLLPDNKKMPTLRAASFVLFALRLVGHVVRRRSDYDLVTVSTIPPLIMGIAARTIKRLTGIPYLYHCLDIYPEVAVVSGMARNRLLVKVARRLDLSNCRKAAAVVVLSNDMRTTLERRGLDTTNVVVLNNFEVRDAQPSAAESPLPKDPDKYRVLFAGNIGRFQALENLVTAAQRLAPEFPNLEFVFVGAGASVHALRAQAGPLVGTSIRFIDHQPVDVAVKAMEECQLGVVSLRPRIHEVSYPSKLSMYLAAGCRVIGIIESDSDLASLIHDEGVGVTCPPGDVDALVEVLRQEVTQGAAPTLWRERAAAVGEKHFGRRAILAEWSSVIAEIGDRVV